MTTKSVISTFLKKLTFSKQILVVTSSASFQSCQIYLRTVKSFFFFDTELNCQHLESIVKEFSKLFEDMPLQVILYPM